jgi:hypothetical protein
MVKASLVVLKRRIDQAFRVAGQGKQRCRPLKLHALAENG